MYTVAYFINKFEAIPENKWVEGAKGTEPNEKGEYCAYGHCGVRVNKYYSPDEARALSEIFQSVFKDKDGITFFDGLSWAVVHVNDGISRMPKYSKLETPKARILAALRDIKAMQEKEPKPERVKTVYVSVPETIKEQTGELILS